MSSYDYICLITQKLVIKLSDLVITYIKISKITETEATKNMVYKLLKTFYGFKQFASF